MLRDPSELNVESLQVFLRNFRQASSSKALMSREELSKSSAEIAAKFLQDHWANTRGLTLRNVPNGSLLLTFSQSQLNHLVQDPKSDSDARSLQEFLLSLSQDDAKLVMSKPELQKLDAKEAACFLSQHFFNPRKIDFVADNVPIGSILLTYSVKQLEHLFLDPSTKSRAEDLHRYLVGLGDQASLESSRMDVEAWKKSFTITYKDPQKMLPKFLKYVKKCSDLFGLRSTKFFSPYITVVQSSGYGKSRLLREVSRNVRVMYVSMLKSADSGFPRPTEDAVQAIFGGLSTGDKKEFERVLAQRLRKCHIAATSELPLPGTNDPLNEPLFPSERHQDVWDFEKHREAEDSIIDCSKELVILVIDEAKALLAQEPTGISRFLHLRRALRNAATDLRVKIFAVLMDTFSQIQNFAPADDDAGFEYSARADAFIEESASFQLFHPFILRNSFDSCFSKLTSDDLSSLVTSHEYLNAGRPLLVCIEATEGEDPVAFPKRDRCTDKEITFLCKKLRGGPSSYTDEGALSHILCRVAASLSPQHPFASQLVAGNMATLLSTDFERHSALSCYVAEPKLAIAASEEWGIEEKFIRFFLPALNRSILTGAISLGHRGELTAQIIMLWAFDAACRKQGLQAGQCVKVKAVLVELLPEDADDEKINACIPEGLEEAYIACCQFVNLVLRLRPEIITQLAERHVGAALREGQRGADLLVPIMMLSSLLIIQVKNYCDEDKPSVFSRTACSKLLPSNSFKDDVFPANLLEEYDKKCVRIFMQLGSRLTSSSCDSIEGEDPTLAAPLQLFGVNSRCLTERVKSALRSFLNGCTDLETMSRDSLCKAERSNVPFPHSMDDIRCAWPFVCRGWEEMTVEELKDLCKGHQLPLSGDKRALLERLRQFFTNQ